MDGEGERWLTEVLAPARVADWQPPDGFTVAVLSAVDATDDPVLLALGPAGLAPLRRAVLPLAAALALVCGPVLRQPLPTPKDGILARYDALL